MYQAAARSAWKYCLASFGAVGMAFSSTALAQADYPTRPVTIMTPFSVGSGFIAIEQARRAANDGYTLLQLDSEHIGALPHLYKKRGYQPFELFDPVAPLFQTPFMVMVSSNSPLKSFKDLVEAVKKEPNKIAYGSWGIGSPGHLGAIGVEMFAQTPMQHVPYKEMAQLFAAVSNQEVDWSFGSIPSSQGPYQAGKLRYLAIGANKRIPQLPDVPTIAESGGPADLDVSSFVALLAPKGISKEIAGKIHAATLRALAQPDIRERFNTFAFEPLDWSTDRILKEAQTKSEVYARQIDKAGVTLD